MQVWYADRKKNFRFLLINKCWWTIKSLFSHTKIISRHPKPWFHTREGKRWIADTLSQIRGVRCLSKIYTNSEASLATLLLLWWKRSLLWKNFCLICSRQNIKHSSTLPQPVGTLALTFDLHHLTYDLRVVLTFSLWIWVSAEVRFSGEVKAQVFLPISSSGSEVTDSWNKDQDGWRSFPS